MLEIDSKEEFSDINHDFLIHTRGYLEAIKDRIELFLTRQQNTASSTQSIERRDLDSLAGKNVAKPLITG